MKKLTRLWLCISASCVVVLGAAQHGEKYTIMIEPTWRTLDPHDSYTEKLGGHWILVGHFTFKKKSEETVHLDKLSLQWHGPVIEKLVGELYSKRQDHEFVPLEEYLVCDGVWCKVKQELLLEFQSSLVLGPVNEFCLVLTLPKHLHEVIRQGTFNLSLHTLPQQFREAVGNRSLSLSFTANARDTACKVSMNTGKHCT